MQTDISDNYLVIQGWMRTRLGLKGSELLVYALVYGYSQDGISTFTGSVDYIQEWTGASSRQTVYNALNSLVKNGLIVRREFVQANGTRGVEYFANLSDGGCPKNGQAVQKMDCNCPKNGQRVSKKWTETVQKLDTDNIDYNYNNTIGDNNTPSSACADGESASADDGGKITEVSGTSLPTANELHDEFEQLWKMYPRKEGKDQARQAYRKARRKGVSMDAIRAGIEAYNERIDREQIGMRYIVHGGNWFEGKRWEDDNTTAPPDGGGTPRGRQNKAAVGYPQHRYTPEQLRQLGIDMGEDVYAAEADAT